MNTEQQAQDHKPDTPDTPGQAQAQDQAQAELQALDNEDGHADFDGLKDRKPEELTPEELRLMADTMPGEGPGD